MTIWLSPRRTIDGVLATRPRHLVWLLASLGAIASFYDQLLSFGLTSQLLDWRILLGFVVASAAFGVASLYLGALVLSWIGKLLGGSASPLELRAVLAWSTAPTILGSTIILVLLTVLRVSAGESVHEGVGFSALLFAIFAICGFRSLTIQLLMLSRTERFGVLADVRALFSGPVASAGSCVADPYLPVPTLQHAERFDDIPTLVNGDYFFVSKYAYGYSHYSLPFSPPLFSGRILGSEPDAVTSSCSVCRRTSRRTTSSVSWDCLGDRIQMKEGLLYINDTPVHASGWRISSARTLRTLDRSRETLA